MRLKLAALAGLHTPSLPAALLRTTPLFASRGGPCQLVSLGTFPEGPEGGGGGPCVLQLHVLGGPAGYRERLLVKISDHYVNRRPQNFLRAISPYDLPDHPVEKSGH